MKKKITVAVPVYNEKLNIHPLYERVTAVFRNLPDYDYEIVFFDDGSTDGSREEIESLSREDPRVKAVFYYKNFGYSKTIFYSMQQAKGDCAVMLHADLQNPPELIPAFIQKWEAGAKIVQGVKTRSKENRLMFFLRTVFYFLMDKVFGVHIKKHVTEFGLFDRSFLDLLKDIKTNSVFFRGLIAEYGTDIEYIEYTQDKRGAEQTKFNISKYYDFAIEGIVASSKCLPRRIIALCGILLLVLIGETIAFFIRNAGEMTPAQIENAVILRVILLAALCITVLLCFIFEYIIGLISRSGEKPFVVEEKRIND